MTIDEIARRAGVSKTAVSRYLNNGSVSAEKRARIGAVIEETGYIPSRRAQDLRRGNSHIIGVILPRIDSEPIGRAVAGISQVLEERGFQLLLANTGNSLDKELMYLEYFKNNQVDGVLLLAKHITARHSRALAESTVPVVVVGQWLRGLSCVYYDECASTREMAALLLERGCRHLALLDSVPHTSKIGAARLHGIRDAMAACGIPAERLHFENAGEEVADGYQAGKRLMQTCPEVDGILCGTDAAAVGVLSLLRERGQHVPEQVMVAGIGHSHLSRLITPCLTTVQYQYETCGAEAARILLQILNTGVDPKQQQPIAYKVEEQATTRPQADTALCTS